MEFLYVDDVDDVWFDDYCLFIDIVFCVVWEFEGGLYIVEFVKVIVCVVEVGYCL